MNIFEVIEQRKSCRKYLADKKVPDDILRKILDAGRLAPSACNLQPWRFLCISSEPKLSEIKSCYGAGWIGTAPHILVVVGTSSTSWVRGDGYNSVETDATIAMDHMILAAEALGVSSCWIGAFDYPALRKVLSLNEDEKVFAMTPFGYSAETRNDSGSRVMKNRKTLEEIAEFI